jgi:DNA-binding LacI/PurR family transcriptional regulator/biotin operon repressor
MQRKPLIKERLTEELRSQIKSMQQNDYVKIAPERELAESLGVSRISLRAAIKTLVDEGLLAQQQGRGTYIRPKQSYRALYMLCPPDMKTNDPYYNQFLLEMTTSAAKLAVSLTMVDPDRIEGDPNGILIAMGLVDQALLERIARQYGHLIVVQAGESSFASVRLSYDDARIGRQAAEILLEHGFQRFIHLAGPAKYPSAHNRRRGFTERLLEAGCEPIMIQEKMNWPGGYRSADQVLELLQADSSPAGIFAANDWMAVGLIQKLKERGLRVPEAVSVIGCDDIHLAREFEPALSTFRLDMKELVTGLLNAVGQIETGQPTEQTILLPARFMNRDTLLKHN